MLRHRVYRNVLPFRWSLPQKSIFQTASRYAMGVVLLASAASLPGTLQAADHAQSQTFNLENGIQGEYLGQFSLDAKFRKPTKLSCFRERHTTGQGNGFVQDRVPSGLLHSYATTREDYPPPRHASASIEPRSIVASTASDLATLVYGHRRVLTAPQRLTTDSQQRVIVTDPIVRAVHVLDPKGEGSFTILGGGNRRLQYPSGVAVDGNDKLYIADAMTGLVLVYDRDGKFVRTLGEFHGESLFEAPSAIAIDREHGHLYLADGPRNVLLMLDLDGNELTSAGQRWSLGDPDGLKTRYLPPNDELRYPTDIAIGNGHVVVLDSEGTRVRILDLQCNFVGGFSVRHAAADRADGLAIDKNGNIFVSYINSSEIRIFKADGTRIGSFGQMGSRTGQFNTPRGLFIDEAERIHVADADNSRIQVFQLRTSESVDAEVKSGMPEGDKTPQDASLKARSTLSRASFR